MLEKLNPWNKLFKKLNKSRLHIDKEIYKNSKYALKLIASKKQAFFKEKLPEPIGKPNNYGNLLCNWRKILWPMRHSISKILKNIFSNLARSHPIKLPNPPDKYNSQSVIRYYSNFIRFQMIFACAILLKKRSWK